MTPNTEQLKLITTVLKRNNYTKDEIIENLLEILEHTTINNKDIEQKAKYFDTIGCMIKIIASC